MGYTDWKQGIEAFVDQDQSDSEGVVLDCGRFGSGWERTLSIEAAVTLSVFGSRKKWLDGATTTSCRT